MTPRQQKKALERDRVRAFREQQREIVRTLRERTANLRSQRITARKTMRHQCRAHRLAARERAKQIRTELMAEIRRRSLDERQAARAQCHADHAAARELGDQEARSRAELRAEVAFQRELRRIEAANKHAAKQVRAGRHERLSESDDAVRANLPHELVPLFNRVRGRIKSGPRVTRTEAFLQYAEEHPGEVLEAMGDRSDEVIRELERDTRRASRARYRPSSEASLAPF